MTILKGNRICLHVSQEPISKGRGVNDYIDSKLYFRSCIKKQIDEWKIKPFQKKTEIALKITFYTERNNKFLLHNLVKNYLDLLHKDLYSKKEKKSLDNNVGLLFEDDDQIKILSAEKIKLGKPKIIIQVYSIHDFYKRLDTNIRKHEHRNFETNEEHYFGSLDAYNELQQIGDKSNSFRRFQLLSNAQKEYLYHSQLRCEDYNYYLLPEVPSFHILKEKYNGNNVFQKKMFHKVNTTFTAHKRLTDSVNYSIGFNEINFTRTNKLLRKELMQKLKTFKRNNFFIFPFITPITLTVFVMQSKNQKKKDIDNIIKELFVKQVNSLIKAPEKPIVPFFELSKESEILSKKGFVNKYQVIEIDYDEFNSINKNGWIGFCLGDIDTYKDIFAQIEN